MSLRTEVMTQIAALVTAAFGLVAALAWNGAIQALFKEIFGTSESVAAQISYAVIVTIIAVVATILIARSISSAKAEEV